MCNKWNENNAILLFLTNLENVFLRNVNLHVRSWRSPWLVFAFLLRPAAAIIFALNLFLFMIKLDFYLINNKNIRLRSCEAIALILNIVKNTPPVKSIPHICCDIFVYFPFSHFFFFKLNHFLKIHLLLTTMWGS